MTRWRQAPEAAGAADAAAAVYRPHVYDAALGFAPPALDEALGVFDA